MANKKSKVQEVIDKVIGTKEEQVLEAQVVEEVQPEQPQPQSKATDYVHKELPSLLALRKKFGK